MPYFTNGTVLSHPFNYQENSSFSNCFINHTTICTPIQQQAQQFDPNCCACNCFMTAALLRGTFFLIKIGVCVSVEHRSFKGSLWRGELARRRSDWGRDTPEVLVFWFPPSVICFANATSLVRGSLKCCKPKQIYKPKFSNVRQHTLCKYAALALVDTEC